MTAVDDLIAWLTQIWDEDEARLSSPYFCGPVWPTTDQMLARIAADRQILALHQPDRPRATEEDDWGHRKCAGCGWQLDVADGSTLACPTVRLLALPYADRPGYQEAWRP